jgi:hypothetical protein
VRPGKTICVTAFTATPDTWAAMTFDSLEAANAYARERAAALPDRDWLVTQVLRRVSVEPMPRTIETIYPTV